MEGENLMNECIFLDENENSIGLNLWQVYNIWHRNISWELNSLGLTHIQFVLLATSQWLNEKDEDVTQVQIAQFAKLDVMMTSTVLRTLECKDLIKRIPHKKDTRAKCVKISDKGKEILIKALKIVEDVDGEFFTILGDSRSTFNKLLLNLKK